MLHTSLEIWVFWSVYEGGGWLSGCYNGRSEGRADTSWRPWTLDNVVLVSLNVRDPARVEAAVAVAVQDVCGDTGLHCLMSYQQCCSPGVHGDYAAHAADTQRSS